MEEVLGHPLNPEEPTHAPALRSFAEPLGRTSGLPHQETPHSVVGTGAHENQHRARPPDHPRQ